MIYDIAFSLNRSIKVKANSYEEADRKIKEQLRMEGINLDTYTYEEFDCNEEEENNGI